MALQLYGANSEAKLYQKIFENSLHEIYLFQPETLNFIAVNRGARENLGYAGQELRSMTPLDLKPELDLESFRTLLEPLVRGEQEQVLFNTVHRRKDGSLYPVEVNLQVFEHNREKICVALIIDLTDRHKAERELKEKDATLSAIVGSAREAIVMMDGKGKVTFWNQAAEQLFGYTGAEILGKDLHEHVAADERLLEAFQQAFSRFQATGKGQAAGKTMEVKGKRKGGQELDLELSISAVKLQKAWQAVGIVRDIGERKRAEEQLRRQEKQVHMMLQAIPNPAWLITKDRRILALNQAAANEFGAAEGDYCWKFIHGAKAISPAQRQVFETTGQPLPGTQCYFCHADQAMEGKKIENCEVELEGVIWDTWWVPVDENTYLHYTVDVTKYKKMEETLRQREEFLQLLLTSMPAGVIIIDTLSHRIENVNLEAAAIIGAGPEEIIGKTCFELFPERREVCPITTLGQEVDRAERILRRADGAEIPVLKTVKRLRTESGEKLIETFMDLTERKKMEEELYRLAITDPLTQAFNRSHFEHMLEQEIERAKRSQQLFAIIMADLDHFKSVNDRFGHAAGDLVLKSFVDLIQSRIRKTDCLARWGGEEFIMLLPDTPLGKAVAVAEGIRSSVNSLNVPGVGGVTASFGVAGFCAGDTVDSIIKRADSLLYEAKACGRNCVRASDECS